MLSFVYEVCESEKHAGMNPEKCDQLQYDLVFFFSIPHLTYYVLGDSNTYPAILNSEEMHK